MNFSINIMLPVISVTFFVIMNSNAQSIVYSLVILGQQCQVAMMPLQIVTIGKSMRVIQELSTFMHPFELCLFSKLI